MSARCLAQQPLAARPRSAARQQQQASARRAAPSMAVGAGQHTARAASFAAGPQRLAAGRATEHRSRSGAAQRRREGCPAPRAQVADVAGEEQEQPMLVCHQCPDLPSWRSLASFMRTRSIFSARCWGSTPAVRSLNGTGATAGAEAPGLAARRYYSPRGLHSRLGCDAPEQPNLLRAGGAHPTVGSASPGNCPCLPQGQSPPVTNCAPAFAQVVFIRKLSTGIFWKVVDNVYNPLHLAFITTCNLILAATYKIVPCASQSRLSPPPDALIRRLQSCCPTQAVPRSHTLFLLCAPLYARVR